MDHNVSFLFGNALVELFDVETDEAEVLFVFDQLFEPVDYGRGVFPLVEVAFSCDFAVDAVHDLFADFSYLGLGLDWGRGVDESAGRSVQLVVLNCYECFFVGCSVHPVIDSQLRGMSLFSL